MGAERTSITGTWKCGEENGKSSPAHGRAQKIFMCMNDTYEIRHLKFERDFLSADPCHDTPQWSVGVVVGNGSTSVAPLHFINASL